MKKEFKWESLTAISSLAVAVMALLAAFFTMRQITDFREATRISGMPGQSQPEAGAANSMQAN
jgi:hypothetical protein